MKGQRFKILEIRGDATESEINIATAYIKVRSSKGMKFWVLIAAWVAYFPKPNPVRVLNKILKGREVELFFSPFGFGQPKKSKRRIKAIVQPHITIIGKVLRIEKRFPPFAPWLEVDCGIKLWVADTERQFKKGDYLTTVDDDLKADILSIDEKPPRQFYEKIRTEQPELFEGLVE